MNKKLAVALSSATLLVLPLVTLADLSAGDTSTPGIISNPSLIGIINDVLNFIWPLFIGLAILMFLVAGFLFLTSMGDPDKVSTARQAVLWGVVGVVVGLIAFSIPFVIRQGIGV